MNLFYLPGLRNDVADILSRCMGAPDDAWKRMDTIDQKDFDYVPLLAMEPAYLFTLAQCKGKTSLAEVLNACHDHKQIPGTDVSQSGHLPAGSSFQPRSALRRSLASGRSRVDSIPDRSR